MTVRTVVERHGHFAHGGNPDDTAEAWVEAGFDGHEVDEARELVGADPGDEPSGEEGGGEGRQRNRHQSGGDEELARGNGGQREEAEPGIAGRSKLSVKKTRTAQVGGPKAGRRLTAKTTAIASAN